MDRLEKYQTVILFIAVIVGVCLGQIASIATSAEMLILPFLLLMLYGLFLNIPLKQIKQSFQHKRFFGQASFLILSGRHFSLGGLEPPFSMIIQLYGSVLFYCWSRLARTGISFLQLWPKEMSR